MPKLTYCLSVKLDATAHASLRQLGEAWGLNASDTVRRAIGEALESIYGQGAGWRARQLQLPRVPK
jgi:hypothetical protein